MRDCVCECGGTSGACAARVLQSPRQQVLSTKVTMPAVSFGAHLNRWVRCAVLLPPPCIELFSCVCVQDAVSGTPGPIYSPRTTMTDKLAARRSKSPRQTGFGTTTRMREDCEARARRETPGPGARGARGAGCTHAYASARRRRLRRQDSRHERRKIGGTRVCHRHRRPHGLHATVLAIAYRVRGRTSQRLQCHRHATMKSLRVRATLPVPTPHNLSRCTTNYSRATVTVLDSVPRPSISTSTMSP